jgi:fructose-bisphosphate aldolase class II
MPIVDLKGVLDHAHQHRYAVPAFEVERLEWSSQLLHAAEQQRSPLIWMVDAALQAESGYRLLPSLEQMARRAQVPVAIQLLRGRGLADAEEGIRQGCNGVAAGAGGDAMGRVESMVAMAQGCGVAVEGAPVAVDQLEAARAMAQSGVDAVALTAAAGEWEACVLQQLSGSVELPLVLHDAEPLAEGAYSLLLANGVSKINYRLAGEGAVEVAARTMQHCNSAGQADTLLGAVARWSPVEHLIIFNAECAAVQAVEMMAEGRRVLSQIPGVRAVFTGDALQQQARYRYTWLVRFCHPAVIDSYRDHPDHVAFADNWFRPIAGDRISIDYIEVADAP